MDRGQIENIYLVNGLGDFRLRNLGDLVKCHGINARTVDGYSELSDEDKESYEKFIVNVMNGMGMMSRVSFVPKRVYRAYDVDFLVKSEDYEDSYSVIGGEVWNISSLEPTLAHKWNDEDFEISPEEVIKEKSKKDYLRIEYSHDNRNEWLHIIKDGEEWY